MAAGDSPAGARPRPRRRARWRLWLGVPLALTLLLAILVLERSPAAPVAPPPDAAAVSRARALYNRIQNAQLAPAQVELKASVDEINAATSLAGRAFQVDRVSTSANDTEGRVTASVSIPLGFWLNLHGILREGKGGKPRFSARIGDLPIPSFIVHAGIEVARWGLRARGAQLDPLSTLVAHVDVHPDGVIAQVDLPRGTRVVSAVGTLVADPLPTEVLAEHYCHLIETQRNQPSAMLVDQVHRAFGHADGSVAANRAAFVALAMMVTNRDAGTLLGNRQEVVDRCGQDEGEITLQGRHDLAQHWSLSAALASAMGTDVTLSLGVWKELFDSRAGGSGFSLVDLSADRSGVFFGQRSANPTEAAKLQQWLATATEADLLPLSALAMAEGMTEQEFRNRYTSVESADFAEAVARIDRQLAVLMR